MKKNTFIPLILIALSILMSACTSDSSIPFETDNSSVEKTSTSFETQSTPLETQSTSFEPPSTLIDFTNEEFRSLLHQNLLNIDLTVPEIKNENIGAKGGDGIFYYIGQYKWEFTYPPRFVRGPIGAEECNEWYSDFLEKGTGPSLSESPNAYTLYKHFNLTWDDIKQLFTETIELMREAQFDPQTYINIDEWQMIFTASEEEITQQFIFYTAIAVGNKAFSVEWLYQHSLSDYLENGITPEMLKEKLSIYKETFSSEELLGNLELKFTAYESICFDIWNAYTQGESFDVDEWVDENLNNKKPDDEKPDDENSNEEKPDDESLNEEKPSDENSNEEKPDDESLNEEKPEDESLNEEKPSDENSNEEKPDDESLNEEKPSDEI